VAVQGCRSGPALVSRDVIKISSMKRVTWILFLSVAILPVLFSQEIKPKLLKLPDNWEFERFSLPPSFAPGIKYKGFEELRFAPGMFKKDSLDYFTYIFVASIDSLKDISRKDVQAYLVNYYKGLCGTVAKDNKLTIDISKITAVITRKRTLSSKTIIYDSSLTIFGVFADGALLKLNMEIKVVKDMPHQKIYLLFVTSPQPKTSAVWDKLYEIQRNFKIPPNSG
jgi:hypothetical protein